MTDRTRVYVTLLMLAVSATGTAQQSSLNGGLTPEELALEPPTDSEEQGAIAFEDAEEVRVTPLARGAYTDAEGRLAVDALEGDTAFFALRLETPDGVSVMGADAKVSIDGTSLVQGTIEARPTFKSDEYGIVEIPVRAGKMGVDVVTVEVAGQTTEFGLNVISLAALSAPQLPNVEDGLAWSELFQADLKLEGNQLAAIFPQPIASRNGEIVRITGFMLPLEPEEKQERFLLTSSPPHCYFDVPGGPAGAVEVLAPKGIDVSWSPIVIEGRFETIALGNGTVYRLHDAKLVNL